MGTNYEEDELDAKAAHEWLYRLRCSYRDNEIMPRRDLIELCEAYLEKDRNDTARRDRTKMYHALAWERPNTLFSAILLVEWIMSRRYNPFEPDNQDDIYRACDNWLNDYGLRRK